MVFASSLISKVFIYFFAQTSAHPWKLWDITSSMNLFLIPINSYAHSPSILSAFHSFPHFSSYIVALALPLYLSISPSRLWVPSGRGLVSFIPVSQHLLWNLAHTICQEMFGALCNKLSHPYWQVSPFPVMLVSRNSKRTCLYISSWFLSQIPPGSSLLSYPRCSRHQLPRMALTSIHSFIHFNHSHINLTNIKYLF